MKFLNDNSRQKRVLLVGFEEIHAAGLSSLLTGKFGSSVSVTRTGRDLDDIAGGNILSDWIDTDMIVSPCYPGMFYCFGSLGDVMPRCRILGFSKAFDQEFFSDFFRYGGKGYFLCDSSEKEFFKAFEVVLSGSRYFPAEVARLISSNLGNGGKRSINEAGLTEREREILQCLVNGMSNKRIAIHLDIQEATAKVHVKNLFKKIGATNRTQAAVWAINRGMAAAA